MAAALRVTTGEAVAPARLVGGDGGWIPIRLLIADTPGGSAESRKRTAHRRWDSLRRSGDRAGMQPLSPGSPRREQCVAPDVDWFGRRAGDLVAPAAAPRPEPRAKPPGWDRADEGDQAHHEAAAWARMQWRRIRDEHPTWPAAQRYAAYLACCAEKLRAQGTGTSLKTAYRLASWHPELSMYVDGRRERGARRAGGAGNPGPGSEAFRAYLLHVWLKIYNGRPKTIKPAWKTACGWALKHGEQAASYDATRAWLRRQVPELRRAFFETGERRWLRKFCESARREKDLFVPMECWSADWHLADFIATRDGRPRRPWLCVYQDFASGIIVGWRLALRPSAEDLMLCYMDAVLKWGAPKDLVIDNGQDFAAAGFTGGKPARRRGLILTPDQGERMAAACEETGTAVHFCWPFNPGSKWCESWFGHGFGPGVSMLFRARGAYIGNCPEARPEEHYRRLRAGQVDVPTVAETEGVIRQYIETVWHAERRAVLGDRSQLEVYEQDGPIAKRTAPEHVLRRLLMPRRVVKVRRGGTVELDGILYGQDRVKTSGALFDLQRQEVQLRWDNDRSRVFVFRLAGEPLCEARNARLCAVGSADVKELRRRQKAARKLCRDVLPAARIAEKDLDVLAMIEHRARLAAEQTGRKAAGAEGYTPRPMQLIPGATRAAAAMPMPRASRVGHSAPDPLDAVELAPRPVAPPPADPLDGLPAWAQEAAAAGDPLDEPLGGAPGVKRGQAGTDDPLDDDRAWSAEPAGAVDSDPLALLFGRDPPETVRPACLVAELWASQGLVRRQGGPALTARRGLPGGLGAGLAGCGLHAARAGRGWAGSGAARAAAGLPATIFGFSRAGLSCAGRADGRRFSVPGGAFPPGRARRFPGGPGCTRDSDLPGGSPGPKDPRPIARDPGRANSPGRVPLFQVGWATTHGGADMSWTVMPVGNRPGVNPLADGQASLMHDGKLVLHKGDLEELGITDAVIVLFDEMTFRLGLRSVRPGEKGACVSVVKRGKRETELRSVSVGRAMAAMNLDAKAIRGRYTLLAKGQGAGGMLIVPLIDPSTPGQKPAEVDLT